MNAIASVQNIQKQITAIKDQLLTLDRMRPGSISRQYNTCGKAGCRCKDPENPKRHGPYYRLETLTINAFAGGFFTRIPSFFVE